MAKALGGSYWWRYMNISDLPIVVIYALLYPLLEALYPFLKQAATSLTICLSVSKNVVIYNHLGWHDSVSRLNRYTWRCLTKALLILKRSQQFYYVKKVKSGGCHITQFARRLSGKTRTLQINYACVHALKLVGWTTGWSAPKKPTAGCRNHPIDITGTDAYTSNATERWGGFFHWPSKHWNVAKHN